MVLCSAVEQASWTGNSATPHIPGSPAPLRILCASQTLMARVCVGNTRPWPLREGEQDSGRSFLHMTSVIWWLLDPEPVTSGASGFCFCSGNRTGSPLLLPLLCQQAAVPVPTPALPGSPYCNSLHSLHWNGALQDPSGTTHPTVCTPQSSPVFLGADPCPPSQYFKRILQT